MFASLLHDRLKNRTQINSPLLGQPVSPREVTVHHVSSKDRLDHRKHVPPLGAAPVELTESELNHLIDYWSQVPAKPLTATLRLSLFTHHLAVTLETHPLYEQMLEQTRRVGLVPLISLQDFTPAVVTIATNAIYAAQLKSNPTTKQETEEFSDDDRVSIGMANFLQELNDQISQLHQTPHNEILDYMGIHAIITIIHDTLVTISHEYLLARQIYQTARRIKSMQQSLDGDLNDLPIHFLAHLQRRRQIFVTDLRLYNRLIRQGLGLHQFVKVTTLPVNPPSYARISTINHYKSNWFHTPPSASNINNAFNHLMINHVVDPYTRLRATMSSFLKSS